MSTDNGIKIEVINRDIETKEGWDAYLDREKARARELSKKKDPGFVTTGLFLRKDPITEEPSPTGYLLAMFAVRFHGSDAQAEEIKEGYSRLMRAIAIVGEAFACFYRSEIWQSHVDIPLGAKAIPEFIRPSKNPKRTEAIMLMTGHRTFGEKVFSATIRPHPSKPYKREIQPWGEMPGVMVGRFASFLPPLDATSDPIATAQARLYVEAHTKRLVKIAEHNPEPRTAS